MTLAFLDGAPDQGWYQLLAAFVGFNTIVYATLATAKLWPRRRR